MRSTMALDMAGLAEETVRSDEPDVVGAFIEFLKAASIKRHPTGTMPRFNQGRHAGCVQAEFTVLDNLPTHLRIGLFARSHTYPAWIRFANANSATDREKDVRGMSISLSDVAGENLTPGVSNQDFVLNSHPVMVAADTREFLELLRALESGGLPRALYFLSHARSALIGLAARQNPSSHLDIRYWSTTPYLFGPGRAVKYIAAPTSAHKSTKPATLSDNYLRESLAAHLSRSEASFDFLLQFQADARRTPIEDATVEWRENDSPHVRVARIRIPQQNILDAACMQRCEEVAFNPWHCLAEHRPLGSLNRARREIYAAMAAFRRERRV